MHGETIVAYQSIQDKNCDKLNNISFFMKYELLTTVCGI